MNKLFLYGIGALLLMNLNTAAKDYCGAELYSTGVVKYGRFDIRMRTISGSGTVSSFFLYYNESYVGNPEPWREVDIEVLGKSTNVFQSNIITGNAASKTTSEKLHTFNNLSNDYHTYGLEWTPNYIAWFFDGVEVRRTTGSQATECQLKEMSYRLNLWISDAPEWVGAFNPSILPVYQYINWIKYSKYTPGSGTNGTDFTFEWQDDFDTFNSSRWAKGDWTFDGNLVDFSQNNIVVKDGYCVICLTRTGSTGFTGEVPKDHTTSIINNRPAGVKISPVGNLYQNEFYPVSLDGRLVPQKSASYNKANSAVLITKRNNEITPKIQINE